MINAILVRTMITWNPLTWFVWIIRLINKTYYDRVVLVQRINGEMIIFENKKAINHNDWSQRKHSMRIVKLDKPIKDRVIKLTPKNLEKYL